MPTAEPQDATRRVLGLGVVSESSATTLALTATLR